MIKTLYNNTFGSNSSVFRNVQISINKLKETNFNNGYYFKRNYTMIGETLSPSSKEKFIDAYYELCELDYDSVEAFKVLIDKLQDNETKKLMTEFKSDHERHIREITDIMNKKGEKSPPSGPDIKQWLTKGKIYLSNITGDVGLLKGMLSNEKDLESAYETINKRNDKWEETLDMIKRGLQDEHKHRNGLEERIKALEKIK